MRQAIVCFLLVPLVLVSQANADTFDLPLSDPGFELPGDIVPEFALNEWRGDPASPVGAENGISPFEGVQMVRFLQTYPSGPIGFDCTVWQMLDVRPHQSHIQLGNVVLTASALFNRVAGDTTTDTQFSVGWVPGPSAC